MMRNPQILGSRAPRVRGTLLVTLSATLWLTACGLKGPLYLPAPVAPSSAAPAPAQTAVTPSSTPTPAAR